MYKVNGLRKLSDYANALRLASPEIDCDIASIKFDSREANSGDIFIPLKGHKFNGEDFTETALNNGAAVITEKKLNGLTLKVQNVYECLLMLAKKNLENIRPKIIFITGSYGKTTIKDMIKHHLGNQWWWNELLGGRTRQNQNRSRSNSKRSSLERKVLAKA